MRRTTTISLALTSSLVALLACGSIKGNVDEPTTLATIHGTIANSGAALDAAHLKVAILWLDSGANGNRPLSTGTTVPLDGTFPSSFTLRLTAPPPEDALVTPSSGGPAEASGIIVAFDDVDGDGKLALVPPTATGFVDRILGISPDTLLYLEAAVNGLPRGYSLTRVTEDPTGGATHFTSEPISTPIELPLTATTEDQQYMCAPAYAGPDGGGLVPEAGTSSSSDAYWNVASQGTPPGGYPHAGDAHLTCSPPPPAPAAGPDAATPVDAGFGSNGGYTYETCTRKSDVVCNVPYDCVYLNVSLGDIAPPAGWPCP